MAQKFLDYEVLERIGEGARSTIYAVSDPRTHQVYALKRVVREKPKDIRFIEQMQTEFEICKQFSHPNLRKCFDLRIIKTMFLKVTEAFLLMELVDGKPLDERTPRGMIDITDTFLQVANGFKALHALGYAHCDLKPNNILRDDQGHVTIIDFGQGCKIGTVKKRIQGTPDYIAPEQVDRKPISVQTDMYNFGATMYWVITGTNIPTKYTVNRKGDNSFLLDDAIRTPAEFNPRVSPALSNLIMECIATRPSKRPTDMDQIINRLELVKHMLLKSGPLGQTA
jgi:eukaryotic-like serine/threonine-protein kinase